MSSFATSILQTVRRAYFGASPVVGLGQGGSAQHADNGDDGDIIRSNGLGGLMFLLSRASRDSHAATTTGDQKVNDTVKKTVNQAYQKSMVTQTIRNTRCFNAALGLAAALEAGGVPCLCYRGPFSGLRFYGDLGTRPFSDVDLIVPDDLVERAWEIASAEGFVLQHTGMSRGYFRRHHIHWCIRSTKTNLICDLHWAVESPYSLYRIKYDDLFARAEWREWRDQRWREPRSEDLFLLLCMHLCKHEPKALQLLQDPDAESWLFDQQLFWKWMDIALVLKAEQAEATFDRFDWPSLLKTATEWRAMNALLAGVAGAERFFGTKIPDVLQDDLATVLADLPAASSFEPQETGTWFTPKALDRLIFRFGGFRSQRIGDFLQYMFPPADYFRSDAWPLPLKRAGHAIKAMAQFLFGVVDTFTQFIRAFVIRKCSPSLSSPVKTRSIQS